MKNETLKVGGMSCSHCEKAVADALNDLGGLSAVKVDLDGGTASFSFDSSQTDIADIKAAIAEAGYSVT